MTTPPVPPTTGPNPTISASASSVHANAIPSEVGWQFVPQYYTYVNKHPGRLHCFYTKNSTFIHGTEGEDGPASYGQQEIHNKIMSIGFQDAKVYIHSVDAQSSAAGGIVIMVIGEMSNQGGAWRKFSQTFFLAEQPNGYFVLNDIFRFLKEDSAGDDDASDPDAAPEGEPTTFTTPSTLAAPMPASPAPASPVPAPAAAAPASPKPASPAPALPNGVHAEEKPAAAPVPVPVEPEARAPTPPAAPATPPPTSGPGTPARAPSTPPRVPTPAYAVTPARVPTPARAVTPAPPRAPTPPASPPPAAAAPAPPPVAAAAPPAKPAPKTWANLVAKDSNKPGRPAHKAQEASALRRRACRPPCRALRPLPRRWPWRRRRLPRPARTSLAKASTPCTRRR